MADRSLKDIIRFVDPSGEISDAEIATITSDLKFTEVLDVITAVSKDDLDTARNILSNYDSRFNVAKEYSNVPMTPQTKSTFKPIKPIGSTAAPNPQQQGDQDQEIADVMDDPANKNRPEVRQIQSLLQRMKR